MSIEDTIDNALRDHGVSPDAMRWTPEDSEVTYLRQRLAAAEKVATLYGWCSGGTEGKQEKAAEQAYCDWANTYGAPRPSPQWRALIDELARQRDEVREATLRGLRRRP